MPPPLSSRMTPWLFAGMALGLGLAMMGLMQSSAPAGTEALPASAAARVGDEVITRAAYAAALEAVSSDRRAALTAAERRQVLQTLVNEAMLVAHGRALDLPARVPRLRSMLVDEVLEILRSEAASDPPTDAELARYLARHAARFRGPDLLHLRALRLPDRAAALAARSALEAAARQEQPPSRLTALPEGAQWDAALPDGPLPPDKLRDYLGPSATAAAAALAPGEISAPLAAGEGFVLLQLVARYAAAEPALETIRPALRNAMLRDRAEALLQQRLAMLRSRLSPEIAEDLQP